MRQEVRSPTKPGRSKVLLVEAVERLSLDRIDTDASRPPQELADVVLAAAAAQDTVGRTAIDSF